MIVSPVQAQVVPPQVLTSQTPVESPAFQAAVAGAQSVARPVATQTTSAAQPTGRSENSRDSRSGTDTGQAKDTGAAVLRARSSAPHRGQNLDITV